MSRSVVRSKPVLAFFNGIAVAYLILMAVAALAITGASAFGILPWLSVPFDVAPWTVELGPFIQGGLTLLAVTLLFFVPSAVRVLRLEHSHRDFMIRMEDVHKAYVVAHAEDRAGLFNMASEFDGVRERINFMRNHPDLSRLEPTVMEAAAQMSHVSKDLAEVYSDEKIDRARSFLRQRQQELESFNDNLYAARKRSEEVKTWSDQLDSETIIARQQLAVLKSDLEVLLPSLGLSVTEEKPVLAAADKAAQSAKKTNVVAIPKSPAVPTAAE